MGPAALLDLERPIVEVLMPGSHPLVAGHGGLRRSVLQVVVILLLPAAAAAQDDGALLRARSERQAFVRLELRRELLTRAAADLERLVRAQADFHGRSSRYAGELETLPDFEVSRGATIQLVGIHPQYQGYAAEATPGGLNGSKCVVFAGAPGTPVPATKFGRKPDRAGVIVCDAAD